MEQGNLVLHGPQAHHVFVRLLGIASLRTNPGASFEAVIALLLTFVRCCRDIVVQDVVGVDAAVTLLGSILDLFLILLKNVKISFLSA